jgi:hypothetical protein
MKYLKLFEDFNLPSDILIEDFVFDWFPYDQEIENPINSSIPESLSYSDLKKMSPEFESMGASKVGIFIAHKKNKDGGFIRLVTSSMSPLKFDYSQFNKNYEPVGEYKGINQSDLEGEGIANIKAGASIISRFTK